MLAIVTIGFLAGLIVSPPDAEGALRGLQPRLAGVDSALLAVGMLGATVMPHAVYLHSALVRDRHGKADAQRVTGVLGAIRLDVVLAMVLAGSVNISMLLLSASALFGLNLVGLTEVHSAITSNLGTVIGTLFALALLASGLASTSVGGYAGAVIMAGLLHRRIPLMWRRILTAVPALGLLIWGLDPTRLLIWSQVILSFGIPFALIPLLLFCRDRSLMGTLVNRRSTTVAAVVITVLIVSLNAFLLQQTLT
jgi:manganese transport protein